MTTFRFAKTEDAPEIVHLLRELGYSSEEKVLQHRLSVIRERNGQIIVAVRKNEIVGCVNVFIDLRLAEGEVGEIVSLIVKREFRGQGIGKKLVDEAKGWLTDNNCSKIRVRANAIRDQAHQFYKRQGFDEIKSQKVFLLETKDA